MQSNLFTPCFVDYLDNIAILRVSISSHVQASSQEVARCLSDHSPITKSFPESEPSRAANVTQRCSCCSISTRSSGGNCTLRSGTRPFAFCTEGLGYSESDAGRRISVARCIARFSEVFGLLESNAVTIVTVSRVASILTAENKDELLARIRGRTQDEVDAIVAEHRPRATEPRDRAEVIACRPASRPQTAPLLTAMTAALEADPSPACTPAAQYCETSNDSHHGSECKDRAEVLATETRLKYSFAASERFKAKFDRVRSLAAHRLPVRASYEDVFELLMDEFLEREDPRKRRERREKRVSAAVRRAVRARHRSVRVTSPCPCATESFTGTTAAARSWERTEDDVAPPTCCRSIISNPSRWAAQARTRICGSCAPVTINLRQSGCWAGERP